MSAEGKNHLPRVVFFGFSDVGTKCLKLLLESPCEVVAVFTHDTDLHEAHWFDVPEAVAEARGIPVYKPKSLKSPEWAELVRSLKPDLLLSLFYRNFIPKEIFSVPRLGAYNMHGSYLPAYRGRAPLNWAIINGEDHGGVSLHVMEEGFDTGDIVLQKRVDFGADEYVGQIQPRITKAAVDVLRAALPSLLEGNPKLEKQDGTKASYFGRRRPEDGRIDFSKSAGEVFNMVRGLSKPFPGAFTDEIEKGGRLIIWRALPLSDSEAAQKANLSEDNVSCAHAGAELCKDPLLIKCGRGAILVQEAERASLEAS